MQRTSRFLTLLMGTVLTLASFTALSCNGNGGASDSDGGIYMGGGTSTGSSGQPSGGNISALDILNLSNSDAPEAIVDLFATGTVQDAGAETQTVSFPANAIGLPSGGTATLTITGGGYSYSGTARADANGNVTFEIPLIASGKRITVGLSVKAADGTILYSGSKEQVARGSSVQISVALTRQFWTLPASFRAVASPAGILYNPATADSVTSTISVEGLDGAPAGVSYVWTDEAGSQLGTGATLTRTASEVTGGIAPADEITKTYTVTVSYTDAAGEAKTASASASVTVGFAVTLPAFSISMAAPASMDSSRSTTSAWALPDLEDGFTLTPDSSTGSFPGGTTFHWEIEATGGALITRTTATGENCTVSPADLELDDSSMGTRAAPTTVSVRCTAKNDRAEDDVDAPAITQDMFLFYVIPEFTVTITPPEGYDADKSILGTPAAPVEVPVFALTGDLTNDLTFTAVADTSSIPAGSTTFPWGTATFPAGTVVRWELMAKELTADKYVTPAAPAPTADVFDIQKTPASLGLHEVGASGATAANTIGTTAAGASPISIKCTISHNYAVDDVTVNASVKVFRLPLGSKAAPDAVGDIVFSDGSAEAYTATLTDGQKNAAVAVIFDAANKKGVGLNVGTGKCWCIEGTSIYNTNAYATNLDDGKVNTDQIADLSDYTETNYPAFAYCRSYSVPGFTSGWYLPAKNELLRVGTNRTAVEAAFTSLGKTSPFVEDRIYFVSNQYTGIDLDYGEFVYLADSSSGAPTAGGTAKRNPAGNAIAVRKFD